MDFNETKFIRYTLTFIALIQFRSQIMNKKVNKKNKYIHKNDWCHRKCFTKARWSDKMLIFKNSAVLSNNCIEKNKI